MTEDATYLACGALTIALLDSKGIDEVHITTDPEGTVTGEVNFTFMGQWFSVTPVPVEAPTSKSYPVLRGL